MTYVALAELGALVLTILAFAGLIRAQQRAHARREDLLVNQLLHAVGKTWTPSPDVELRESRRQTSHPLEVRFTGSPEQLPVP